MNRDEVRGSEIIIVNFSNDSSPLLSEGQMRSFRNPRMFGWTSDLHDHSQLAHQLRDNPVAEMNRDEVCGFEILQLLERRWSERIRNDLSGIRECSVGLQTFTITPSWSTIPETVQ